MQKNARTIVVLGTGGTIAGTAPEPSDTLGYTSAQLGVAQLVAEVPSSGASAGAASLEAEQLAQLDSKDIDFATWLALARRVAFHLARPEVTGIVITHGTDTVEETAYFLQRVLAPSKPVVLTGAMRPATSLQADGPQNLIDAVRLAGTDGAQGVMVVLGGEAHGADDVRKAHTYRLAAFCSGDAGVVAQMEAGAVRRHRPWPAGQAFGLERLPADPTLWPRVEIVHSHVNAGMALVRALCADGVRGIVVAGTGNGSVHHALEAALVAAQRDGVGVLRSSRCLDGAIVGTGDGSLPSAGALTPVKARIELMLQLMPGGPAPGQA